MLCVRFDDGQVAGTRHGCQNVPVEFVGSCTVFEFIAEVPEIAGISDLDVSALLNQVADDGRQLCGAGADPDGFGGGSLPGAIHSDQLDMVFFAVFQFWQFDEPVDGRGASVLEPVSAVADIPFVSRELAIEPDADNILPAFGPGDDWCGGRGEAQYGVMDGIAVGVTSSALILAAPAVGS